MKISGQGPVNPYKIYSQHQLKQKTGKLEADSDVLELSSEARQIRQLALKGADLPEMRVELVQNIKSRLEKQVYQVSPQQLAESMLQYMQEKK